MVHVSLLCCVTHLSGCGTGAGNGRTRHSRLPLSGRWTAHHYHHRFLGPFYPSGDTGSDSTSLPPAAHQPQFSDERLPRFLRFQPGQSLLVVHAGAIRHHQCDASARMGRTGRVAIGLVDAVRGQWLCLSVHTFALYEASCMGGPSGTGTWHLGGTDGAAQAQSARHALHRAHVRLCPVESPPLSAGHAAGGRKLLGQLQAAVADYLRGCGTERRGGDEDGPRFQFLQSFRHPGRIPEDGDEAPPSQQAGAHPVLCGPGPDALLHRHDVFHRCV